jgi:hypothetical protein
MAPLRRGDERQDNTPPVGATSQEVWRRCGHHVLCASFPAIDNVLTDFLAATSRASPELSQT